MLVKLEGEMECEGNGDTLESECCWPGTRPERSMVDDTVMEADSGSARIVGTDSYSHKAVHGGDTGAYETQGSDFDIDRDPGGILKGSDIINITVKNEILGALSDSNPDMDPRSAEMQATLLARTRGATKEEAESLGLQLDDSLVGAIIDVDDSDAEGHCNISCKRNCKKL